MTTPPSGSASPPRLTTLSLADTTPPEQRRLHSRRIMIALSHLIEEHAAASGPGCVVIAAFQRLSLLLPEAERYRALAPRLGRLFALGVADVPAPEIPGVTVIPIDVEWPLAQEWCVVGSGPGFCAALLARDAEGFRLDRRSRQFHGAWTSDARQVDRAVRAFFEAVGEQPPALERDSRATLQSTRALQSALTQLYRR